MINDSEGLLILQMDKTEFKQLPWG